VFVLADPDRDEVVCGGWAGEEIIDLMREKWFLFWMMIARNDESG